VGAKQDQSRIVLLAIEPHEPETEYGYVVPHEEVGGFCRFGTRRVSAFIEKPRTELATELVRVGGLWNTMTMVFKADTLLQLVRRTHPVIYLDFCRILEVLDPGGTANDQRSVRKARTGKLFPTDHGENQSVAYWSLLTGGEPSKHRVRFLLGGQVDFRCHTLCCL